MLCRPLLAAFPASCICGTTTCRGGPATPGVGKGRTGTAAALHSGAAAAAGRLPSSPDAQNPWVPTRRGAVPGCGCRGGGGELLALTPPPLLARNPAPPDLEIPSARRDAPRQSVLITLRACVCAWTGWYGRRRPGRHAGGLPIVPARQGADGGRCQSWKRERAEHGWRARPSPPGLSPGRPVVFSYPRPLPPLNQSIPS